MNFDDFNIKCHANDTLNLAITRFEEGGEWDNWIEEVFKDKFMLHLLLGMAVNFKRWKEKPLCSKCMGNQST